LITGWVLTVGVHTISQVISLAAAESESRQHYRFLQANGPDQARTVQDYRDTLPP
jgi:hypothetical protein